MLRPWAVPQPFSRLLSGGSIGEDDWWPYVHPIPRPPLPPCRGAPLLLFLRPSVQSLSAATWELLQPGHFSPFALSFSQDYTPPSTMQAPLLILSYSRTAAPSLTHQSANALRPLDPCRFLSPADQQAAAAGAMSLPVLSSRYRRRRAGCCWPGPWLSCR